MSEIDNRQLIQTAVEKAAEEAGIVDTSLLSLAIFDTSISLLKFNESGQVEGVNQFIDLLKKTKPQYFRVDVRNLPDADYAKAKRRLLTGGR